MVRETMCVLAGMALLSSAASAAVITTDSVPQSGGGWFSSQISDHSDFNREAENISNDSFDTNLANNPDDGPQHTSDPNDSMWLTVVEGFGGTDSAPFIIVDLGAEYLVDGFHLWNYNELGGNTGRGARQVDILSSTGERTNAGDGPPLPETFSLQQSIEFTQAPGVDTYTGEDYVFTTPFVARYIMLDIATNWSGNFSGGTGLSEIQFNQVPEPTALSLLGVAGLMGLRRRRLA